MDWETEHSIGKRHSSAETAPIKTGRCSGLKGDQYDGRSGRRRYQPLLVNMTDWQTAKMSWKDGFMADMKALEPQYLHSNQRYKRLMHWDGLLINKMAYFVVPVRIDIWQIWTRKRSRFSGNANLVGWVLSSNAGGYLSVNWYTDQLGWNQISDAKDIEARRPICIAGWPLAMAFISGKLMIWRLFEWCLQLLHLSACAATQTASRCLSSQLK